jgi:hypothetical protein
VFQRIGPMPPQEKRAKPSHEENFEGGEDKYHQPRWCPDGLSHSQKRRVQRLHNLEEAEAQYLEMPRKARPDLAVKVHYTQEKESCPRKKEWCPKPTNADVTASAGTNMVTLHDHSFNLSLNRLSPFAKTRRSRT